jgi:predicted signal transduction protein with EAL and GGDEF domain
VSLTRIPTALREPLPGSETRSVADDARCLARQGMADFIHHELALPAHRALAVLMVSLNRPRQFESLTRVSAWSLKLRHLDAGIATMLRTNDRYSRLSDDKLCIVLPSLSTGTQAVLAAARIASALQEPSAVDLMDVSIKPSVGIAIWPDGGNDADELVRSADMAAHIAAESGEDYHVLQPEDHKDLQRLDAETESRLVQAIRENELIVHYQPQIDFATGRCVGAEALLRWPTTSSLKVTTQTAIEIAEQGGLIVPLTIGVINMVLRDAVRMRRSGIDLNLSINLSTRMLTDIEIPDIILQAIETWSIPPERLTFEITESVMIGDIERSLAILNRLRDVGVRLSIDDFGTGYSSLAYMKRFPVQELKIDKSFVAQMLTSQGDRQIVQSVIDLSHNFGLQVVAEGVETSAMYDELKAMGCDVAQGFLFSRALGYDAFLEWLKEMSPVN